MASVTYTGVKQGGMPDASGSGNPVSSSGVVSLLQATTTAGYNAWAIMVGVPSTAGTATAGAAGLLLAYRRARNRGPGAGAQVCYPGQPGKDMLVLSFTGFDPGCVKTPRTAAATQ